MMCSVKSRQCHNRAYIRFLCASRPREKIGFDRRAANRSFDGKVKKRDAEFAGFIALGSRDFSFLFFSLFGAPSANNKWQASDFTFDLQCDALNVYEIESSPSRKSVHTMCRPSCPGPNPDRVGN